jgi:hypothetical protein
VTPDVVMAIQFAGFAKQGSWPVGGAVMDQSQWFFDVCQMIWGETGYWEAKR